MQYSSEAELVEKAKHDSHAFGELYDRYYPQIYRYVVLRTADVPTALDITSVVFMKVLKAIKHYTWRDIPFSAWIYRIAGNEVTDHFRRSKRKPLSLEKLLEAYDFEPASMTDLQEEIIAAEEALEKHKDFLEVYAKLTTLDSIYQEVLTLRYFEKKKVKEIALILGRNEGTVKSQLSRGIALLKYPGKGGEGKAVSTQMQPIPALSVIKVGEQDL